MANDDCSTATILAGTSGVVTDSNVGWAGTWPIGNDPNFNWWGRGGGKPKWYKWTNPFPDPVDFQVLFSAPPSDATRVITSIFKGSCGSQVVGSDTRTFYGESNDIGPTFFTSFPIDLVVMPGEDVWIEVDSYSGDSSEPPNASGTEGSFQFAWAANSVMLKDSIDDGTRILIHASATGNNIVQVLASAVFGGRSYFIWAEDDGTGSGTRPMFAGTCLLDGTDYHSQNVGFYNSVIGQGDSDHHLVYDGTSVYMGHARIVSGQLGMEDSCAHNSSSFQGKYMLYKWTGTTCSQFFDFHFSSVRDITATPVAPGWSHEYDFMVGRICASPSQPGVLWIMWSWGINGQVFDSFDCIVLGHTVTHCIESKLYHQDGMTIYGFNAGDLNSRHGGTLTSDGINPSAGDTITITGLGSRTYTFVSTLTGAPAYSVLIGTTAADTLRNLHDIINGTPGAGTEWFFGTTGEPNQSVNADGLTSTTMHVISNFWWNTFTITVSSSSSHLTWSSSTLTGGVDPRTSSIELSGDEMTTKIAVWDCIANGTVITDPVDHFADGGVAVAFEQGCDLNNDQGYPVLCGVTPISWSSSGKVWGKTIDYYRCDGGALNLLGSHSYDDLSTITSSNMHLFHGNDNASGTDGDYRQTRQSPSVVVGGVFSDAEVTNVRWLWTQWKGDSGAAGDEPYALAVLIPSTFTGSVTSPSPPDLNSRDLLASGDQYGIWTLHKDGTKGVYTIHPQGLVLADGSSFNRFDRQCLPHEWDEIAFPNNPFDYGIAPQIESWDGDSFYVAANEAFQANVDVWKFTILRDSIICAVGTSPPCPPSIFMFYRDGQWRRQNVDTEHSLWIFKDGEWVQNCEELKGQLGGEWLP